MLSDRAKAAWSKSFVAHLMMVKAIDKAMAEAGVISLDVYDVLLNLELAPHGRLRMCELADAVLLSRSGLTRLIDRLVAKGLIERIGCQNDRRSTFASLTEAGLRERERAWPVFRDRIEELFEAQLDESELQTITGAYMRIIEAMRPGWEDECLKEACDCSESMSLTSR